jgi:hypothetical protein
LTAESKSSAPCAVDAVTVLDSRVILETSGVAQVDTGTVPSISHTGKCLEERHLQLDFAVDNFSADHPIARPHPPTSVPLAEKVGSLGSISVIRLAGEWVVIALSSNRSWRVDAVESAGPIKYPDAVLSSNPSRAPSKVGLRASSLPGETERQRGCSETWACLAIA